jgi:hypothetical protein
MPAINSDVAIGRSMKGLEMSMPSLPSGLFRGRASGRLGVDAGAGPQLVLPVDDHALAGAEAGIDQGNAVAQLRHGDRPQLDGGIRLMT